MGTEAPQKAALLLPKVAEHILFPSPGKLELLPFVHIPTLCLVTSPYLSLVFSSQMSLYQIPVQAWEKEDL